MNLQIFIKLKETKLFYPMAFFAAVFLFFPCEQIRKPFSNFAVPSELNSNHIPIVKVDSSLTKKIVVNKPLDKIFTSELIEEFIYIPLETTNDSFIGYYFNVIFHNNYIYILDIFSAESVLIYDMQGRFIKKSGQREGALKSMEYYWACVLTNRMII
ncbi:MAG: 6-bladed beta-propeller [Tannerellaceae bacterium]|nr:6-bladed beta-propeller [Tannerellaceae bacterium]